MHNLLQCNSRHRSIGSDLCNQLFVFAEVLVHPVGIKVVHSLLS